MANTLYTPTGNPGAISRGASSLIRNEFQLVAAALASSPLISDVVSWLTSWTQNENANGYTLTGLANAVNPSDAVNLQTAQAIYSGGGTPANIPITSVGVGTIGADHVAVSNVAGNAIVASAYKASDVQRAIRAARYARANS
jgi:hypothetical protein